MKKSSFKGCFCSKAFTLIELLVVILIIGILAAIAVPQYQKAVEKSRATQALTLVQAAALSAQRYYLENGVYPTFISGATTNVSKINQLGLDIDMPELKGFSYRWLYDGTPETLRYVGVTRQGLDCRYTISHTLPTNTRKCWINSTYDSDDICASVCRAICGVDALTKQAGSGEFGCVMK